MPNYGYTVPKWHAFPGTNPNYTPKKKDVGISGTPSIPIPEPTTNGTSKAPKADRPAESTLGSRGVGPVRDFPSFPISPTSAPNGSPDSKSEDGDR
jgi:hypothetical protein